MSHAKLSEVLARHGAGYVLIPAGSKRPSAAGWQRSPKPLAAALRHAAAGGNVGLLCGVGDLIILDADENAYRVEDALPTLRSTIKIFRRNAPDRAKWIVRVVGGGLPPSRKSRSLEILASGRQGVIVGRHESGALIESAGSEIVELTADDIGAVWMAITGEPLTRRSVIGSGSRQPTANSPAEPRVNKESAERGMTLVDAVLAAGGFERSAWSHRHGGLLAELECCPFVARSAEPERQHGMPGKAFVFVGDDGAIAAGCHAARCQSTIDSSGGSGWSLLRDIAGYRAPAGEGVERARQIIGSVRGFVRRADLAAHVPVALQSATGYRTRETDLAVADAILDIAAERGRLERLPLGLRDVRARAGLGSVSTAAAAIERLLGWFVVREERARCAWEAERYSLAAGLIASHVAQIEQGYIYSSSTIYIDTDNQCSIYATSPLSVNRARDAFVTSLSTITEAEVQRRIDARRAEIEAGDETLRPIRRHRYRRRLEASLPAAGRGVLRLIDALTTHGESGMCSRARLRALLNISTPALSRIATRAHDLGLVAAERTQITLLPDWSETLAIIEPHMPSAGRLEEIAEREDIERLAWLQRTIRRPDTPRSEAVRLQRSLERTAERRRQRAALRRPDLAIRHADIAPVTVAERVGLARLAERTAVAHLDRAEERNASQWRLVRELSNMRRDGINRRTARRLLEFAGWERREIFSALASAWPTPIEPGG